MRGAGQRPGRGQLSVTIRVSPRAEVWPADSDFQRGDTRPAGRDGGGRWREGTEVRQAGWEMVVGDNVKRKEMVPSSPARKMGREESPVRAWEPVVCSSD